YKVLKTEDELKTVLNQNLAVHFEFSEFNYHKAELWGIGLSNGKDNYFVSKETLLKSEALKKYLASDTYEKYGYDFKAMKVYLMWQGLNLSNMTYDLLLAAYIIKSSIGKEDFTAIAQSFEINDLSYD